MTGQAVKPLPSFFAEPERAEFLSLRAANAALREQLKKPLDEMEKTSFGLFYIAERIRLCYGDRYGISLDSTPGEGTTVTVSLPARAELINREVFHV